MTRLCASADGEKDEKDENVSGAGRGCHAQVWLTDIEKNEWLYPTHTT